MILDTNGLSAWWLNEPSFIRHIEHADCLCVPVPALAEFRFGILKSRFREKMTTWLEDALCTTTVLVADDSTTRHYAEIRLQLATAETPIPMNDLWIASIARQHKLPILSCDSHFDHVTGITRIGW